MAGNTELLMYPKCRREAEEKDAIFQELFRKWVEMLHHEATTCLVLPTRLSREIRVKFSFR